MIGKALYEWLHELVGRRRIGKFIKALMRPYVTHHDLEGAYAKMAADEEREAEALEWVGQYFIQANFICRGSLPAVSRYALEVSYRLFESIRPV